MAHKGNKLNSDDVSLGTGESVAQFHFPVFRLKVGYFIGFFPDTYSPGKVFHAFMPETPPPADAPIHPSTPCWCVYVCV